MWKDLKFPHVIYMALLIIWEKKPFILLSTTKFVEFDGIQGCVKKAFL